MWRTLLIIHRYLGVAVGALMVMWFVSGIVMMYVGFPRVTEAERVRTLPPIAWSTCCRAEVASIGGDDQVLAASVENLAGAPALTLRRPGRPDTTLDLARGAVVRIDEAQAQAIARDAAPRVTGRPASPTFTGQVQTDQWTVGRLVRDRPLFRFEFDDPARTILYVSGTSGRVVHWTTATQRFWNWLGAIPHWLYFADLRSDVALWSEIVIWTSMLGTFLTVIGLYIGISQLRMKSKGSVSPYRGWFYWHHMTGLVFGIVTLTWVVSGLISMNPWGFLESRRGGGEQSRIAGEPPRWSAVRASLDDIRTQPAVADAVRVAAAPLDGRLYWLVTRRDGEVARIDAAGHLAPLSTADLTDAARRIGAGAGVAEQGMIDGEDGYYFRRRRSAHPARLSRDPRRSGQHALLPRSRQRSGAAACRRQRALAPLAVRRPAPDRFHVLDARASGLGHHRPVPDVGRARARRHRLLPRAAPRMVRRRPCRPRGVEARAGGSPDGVARRNRRGIAAHPAGVGFSLRAWRER